MLADLEAKRYLRGEEVRGVSRAPALPTATCDHSLALITAENGPCPQGLADHVQDSTTPKLASTRKHAGSPKAGVVNKRDDSKEAGMGGAGRRGWVHDDPHGHLRCGPPGATCTMNRKPVLPPRRTFSYLIERWHRTAQVCIAATVDKNTVHPKQSTPHMFQEDTATCWGTQPLPDRQRR